MSVQPHICKNCGHDFPFDEMCKGFCMECWAKIEGGGGVYGVNTIAVSIVVAMRNLGAINVAFDDKGTLRNVQFPRPSGTKGCNGK